MSEPRRNRKKSSEGTRQLLIEAALRVLSRDGTQAATTRRIAEEAGVQQGQVHYWFADKDELLEEAVKAILAEINEATEGVRSSGGTVAQTLRAALQSVVTDDPIRQLAAYDITVYALRSPKLRDLATRQYRLYLQEAQRQLQPFAAEIEATVPGGLPALAALASATFDGIVLHWLADPDPARVEASVTVLIHLLEAAGL
ncbi:TetR/AcrR family transcriptional regulator [Williamsia sp. CHRR-6]|uniref:TetR/AcrR family transcriptional regulator n=1 Tax=Williamsia sp. CHRR-6 TaxID=2835871 RepID=UPI001BDAE061|nr:TetR family transcriptional regulator [Williamsia sp. CHRR-6]MBT0567192.1 TetR family transcriptional regulator [Williamsia sp. CHRR-6]